MKNTKQRGFTLVEIAIVLVVIGLLLGGILKGQQLINSARVRNLADQNTSIQAAYYGFIDRFRNLPGDFRLDTVCANLGAALTNCDDVSDTTGIGGITGTNGGNGRIDTVAEAAAVWGHLSAAGFLNGSFNGLLSTVTGAYYRASGVGDLTVPANAYQGPIALAHSSAYREDDGAGSPQGATVIRLAYSFGGNIPVPILRDLDQKLDDGVAATGVLRTGAEASDTLNAGEVFADIFEYDSTDGDCLSNLEWDVDTDNQNCNGVYLY